MGYRGLILDFVGVMTQEVRDPIGQWCVAEGLAPHAWHEALTVDPRGREHYLALEAGRLTQAEWNRRTALQLGLAESENLMGRAWAQVRRAEDMVALAVAAREAGMTVAMLSNSFGLDPYDPYEHVGVWDLFDVTVLSEREGVAKPDPAIYRLTLDRMGLRGEECVFVDDQEVNLPPAAALGITTVHADGDPGYVGRLASLLGLAPAPGTSRVV
ncbi:HAD family hydrolase [Streptomyces avicenniae]|uniref:HAD family hydrolase n=1 Tax=Streptomyces avicenniae TaxID=500153 RepID=UPI00069A2EC2|nr:HAD family phosphatase [Streptomyces avicenniae]